MKRIDFTNCKLSNIDYSGSDEKIGVIFQNEMYLLKFKRKNVWGFEYNDISEYIGCKIFNMLGISTQFTVLGTYKDRKVVACKDFCYPNKVFKPFSDLGDSSLDCGSYKYSFNDIKRLIYDTKRVKKENKENVVNSFWDTYVVDALIANADRHGRNWGFIKTGNYYEVAPVFDNGNSLFSALNDEEEIGYILSSEDELNEMVEKRPNSLIVLDGCVSNYLDIISSKNFEDCNKAILRIVPKICLNEIFNLVDSIDEEDLSKNRKRFIKTIINLRYEKILLKTYKELTNE